MWYKYVICQPSIMRSTLTSSLQLYVGLTASCILLLAAWCLTRQGYRAYVHPALDSFGLLQLTWLLGHEPSIATRIAEVEEPRTNALRAAGMFNFHASSSVFEKRVGSSTCRQ